MYRKSTHLYGLTEQADLIESSNARVVLVEGPLDAVAIPLAGHVGLAAGGTALTPDHAARLLAVTGPAAARRLPRGPRRARRHRPRRAPADRGAGRGGVSGSVGDAASILSSRGPRGLRRALTHTRPLIDAAVEDRLSTWDRHLDTANVAAAVDAVRHVAPLIASAPAGDLGRLVLWVAAYTRLPSQTAPPPTVPRSAGCWSGCGRGTPWWCGAWTASAGPPRI